MKKEENPVAEVAQLIKRSWRHRPGNKTVGTIMDTFENLKFQVPDGRKPILVGKKKTPYGWHLVFNLPPGISFQQVKRRLDYFADATRSYINLTWNGQLHMDVQTLSLPAKVDYVWNSADYSEMALPVPVGMSHKGPEVPDLADSPHMLVAGTTGFGKSNLLHVLIISLLPIARIGIIDLKRLEFSYLKDRCYLTRNEHDALQLLLWMNKELDRRLDLLEAAGVVKIQDYEGDLPYIVLVVDELAELKDESCHQLLDRLLRLARAVGISVVCATQRPSTKIIDGDSKMNFAARICYMIKDEVHQIPSIAAKAEEQIVEGRKYRIGPVWTFHDLAQVEKISPSLLRILKGNNPNLHLLKSGEDTYRLFRSQLAPFDVEKDLLTMENHWAVNRWRADGRDHTFMCKLLPPPQIYFTSGLLLCATDVAWGTKNIKSCLTGCNKQLIIRIRKVA